MRQDHWTTDDEDRLNAVWLRKHLLQGGAPRVQDPSLRLVSETQYSNLRVTVSNWEGAEVEYKTLKASNPLSAAGAVTSMFTIPYNMAAKASAAAKAQPRWRPTMQGFLTVTNERLIFEAEHSLSSLYLSGIARVEIWDGGVYVLPHDGSAMLLDVGTANRWMWVLLHWLVWSAPPEIADSHITEARAASLRPLS